jgi:hypothetical protein
MTQALVSRLILHLPVSGQTPDVPTLERSGLPVAAHAGFAIAAAAPAGTDDWLDVFPGTAAQLHRTKIAARITTETLIHNHWQWDGAALTLQSDALGLKPLYRAVDAHGGHWFASSMADLIKLHPTLAQPVDRLGLHSLFIGRACWGNRTVHEKISRMATGTRLHWTSQHGLREDRARRWQMLEAEPDLKFETATADLRAALKQSIAAWMLDDAADAQALSGGYDSRLLAALLPRDIKAYTYGGPQLRETQQARLVAKTLGLSQRFVDLPEDMVLDQLALGTRLFEANADLALLQTAPLTPLLPTGSVWLHGYPGDVIAGAFTTRMTQKDFTSNHTLAAAIVRVYTFQGVDAHTLFGFAFDTDALVADIAADLDRSVSPLAAYHLWCWESHLRRYTAGILNVMGETMDVRLPYVWKPYVDLWARIPLQGLQHRAWYKRWLAQDFPALATIAHPDDMQSSRLQQLWSKLRGTSDYIYDRPNLVSARHAAMAEKLIAQQQDALAEQLGLALQPGYGAALNDPRFRTGQARRLLLGLGVYAQMLKTAS